MQESAINLQEGTKLSRESLERLGLYEMATFLAGLLAGPDQTPEVILRQALEALPAVIVEDAKPRSTAGGVVVNPGEPETATIYLGGEGDAPEEMFHYLHLALVPELRAELQELDTYDERIRELKEAAATTTSVLEELGYEQAKRQAVEDYMRAHDIVIEGSEELSTDKLDQAVHDSLAYEEQNNYFLSVARQTAVRTAEASQSLYPETDEAFWREFLQEHWDLPADEAAAEAIFQGIMANPAMLAEVLGQIAEQIRASSRSGELPAVIVDRETGNWPHRLSKKVAVGELSIQRHMIERPVMEEYEAIVGSSPSVELIERATKRHREAVRERLIEAHLAKFPDDKMFSPPDDEVEAMVARESKELAILQARRSRIIDHHNLVTEPVAKAAAELWHVHSGRVGHVQQIGMTYGAMTQNFGRAIMNVLKYDVERRNNLRAIHDVVFAQDPVAALDELLRGRSSDIMNPPIILD